MKKKKKWKTYEIILLIIGIIAAVVGIVWLLVELAPWILMIIAAPVWLLQALNAGGNVK